MSKFAVWIGYDPREQEAFDVAKASIELHSGFDLDIYAMALGVLQRRGMYQRPTRKDGNVLWDVISDAPMSTEFAISRFFVPALSPQYSWAVFMDCDVMLRAPIEELFALADKTKAVQVVKHSHLPGSATTKMDGQPQTAYPRKNWSSVVLWNLKHPANRTLTAAKLNSWSGRALHGFQWLADEVIGELPAEWNHLVGVNAPNPDAKLVHFTLGIPTMAGYQACEHAAEWWKLFSPMRERRCQPPAPLN